VRGVEGGGEGLQGGHIGKGNIGLQLILVGCEHNHVVERTRFHRYAFSQNHCVHDISRVVAGDAIAGVLQGCSTCGMQACKIPHS